MSASSDSHQPSAGAAGGMAGQLLCTPGPPWRYKMIVLGHLCASPASQITSSGLGSAQLFRSEKSHSFVFVLGLFFFVLFRVVS